MGAQISESDWRLFRKLRPLALDRFCDRVLAEIGQLAGDSEKSSHERHPDVFDCLKKRDAELADAFDNPRRSTALIQLACVRLLGLLTDEEFGRFSPETRSSVSRILDMG